MATLTVLGTASGAPVAESGCSAYLVRHAGTSVLLDCGPGSLGPLRAAAGVHELDAVVISHLHSDHVLDLVPLNVALLSEPAVGTRRRLPVFLPPGGLAMLAATFQALTVNVASTLAARYTEALDCREYAAGETLRIGALEVTLVGPLRHATLAFGMRVRAGANVLAYTGDTAPCDAADALARGADVLLAECTYPEPGTHPAALHTSAVELGAYAERAGCASLIATHFAFARWPADRAEREAAIEARVQAGGYTGPLTVARVGLEVGF